MRGLQLLLVFWLIFAAGLYAILPPMCLYRLANDVPTRWRFSTDGTRAISTSEIEAPVRMSDGSGKQFQLMLHRADTGKAIRTLVNSDSMTRAAEFAPDSSLVVAEVDGQVRAWEADTGDELGLPFEGHFHKLIADRQGHTVLVMASDLLPFPPERQLSFGNFSATIRFIDLPSERELFSIKDVLVYFRLNQQEPVMLDLMLSRDNSRAISYSRLQEEDTWLSEFHVWNIHTGKLLGSFRETPPTTCEGRWPQRSISESGETLWLLYNGRNSYRSCKPVLHEWDVDKGKLVRQFAVDASTDDMLRLGLSDSESITVNGEALMQTFALSQPYALLDVGGEKPKFLTSLQGKVVSPDSKLIAAEKGEPIGEHVLFFGSKFKNRRLSVRRIADGEEVASISSSREDPSRRALYTPLAFTPDGNKLVFARHDSGRAAICLFLPSIYGEALRKIQMLRTNPPFPSPSSELPVLAGELRVLDLESGKERVVGVMEDTFWNAKISGDGKLLRVGEYVWNINAGTPWLWILGGPLTILLPIGFTFWLVGRKYRASGNGGSQSIKVQSIH